MRCTCGPPGCVSHSLTSILTSKSLALSAGIVCSAVGVLIVTFGIFLGASESVAGQNAISGSAAFSGAAGGASPVAGGGGVPAVAGGGGGGGTGGCSEPPHAAAPRISAKGK